MTTELDTRPVPAEPTTLLDVVLDGKHKRMRCDACRRMVPLYVDRGDGQPLRRHPWSATDPLSNTPDASLDRGPALYASDVLPACLFCGHRSRNGIPWGRNADVRGTFASGPCSMDCIEATGSDCKCSCGGANHGTLA